MAKLIRTICCCGPIRMQPDRSRFIQLSKFISRYCVSIDTSNSQEQQRNPAKGIKALEDYELNNAYPLTGNLDIHYQVSIGKNIEIFFPAFIPAAQITTPPNATHCKLIAVAAALDFYYYNSVIASDESPLIPLTHAETLPFTLKMESPQPSQQPVFVVLGLSYWDDTTHSKYCQAVKIIHIKNAHPSSKN